MKKAILPILPVHQAFLVTLAIVLLAVSCSESAPTPEDNSSPPDDPSAVVSPTSAPPANPAPNESDSSTSSNPAADSVPDSVPGEPNDPAPVDSPHWDTPFSIEGSTLVMKGEIDVGFAERFLDFVRGREDEITTLRVNSGGGVTDEGIKVGHWIFDHQLDVVVDELCFSSCANYLFTAGKNKTILADSLVGWHGSEQQDEHVARGLGMTAEEVLGSEYDQSSVEELGETHTPAGRKRFIEEILAGRSAAIAEEREFLEKIAVSADALLYGLLPGQFQKYYDSSAMSEIDGWTFSIADMAKFGIKNVSYAGEGDYPTNSATKRYGVTVFDVP